MLRFLSARLLRWRWLEVTSVYVATIEKAKPMPSGSKLDFFSRMTALAGKIQEILNVYIGASGCISKEIVLNAYTPPGRKITDFDEFKKTIITLTQVKGDISPYVTDEKLRHLNFLEDYMLGRPLSRPEKVIWA